jgi:hypothetical protein
MPLPMPNCKIRGEVFPGIYVPEESSYNFKSGAAGAQTLHICSRGAQKGVYVTLDYRDWS